MLVLYHYIISNKHVIDYLFWISVKYDGDQYNSTFIFIYILIFITVHKCV